LNHICCSKANSLSNKLGQKQENFDFEENTNGAGLEYKWQKYILKKTCRYTRCHVAVLCDLNHKYNDKPTAKGNCDYIGLPCRELLNKS